MYGMDRFSFNPKTCGKCHSTHHLTKHCLSKGKNTDYIIMIDNSLTVDGLKIKKARELKYIGGTYY